MNTISILKNLIKEYSSVAIEANEISSNTDLIKDLGYDSLSFIQLISDIEDEYNIIFDLDDLDISTLSKYKEIEKIIVSKLKKD